MGEVIAGPDYEGETILAADLDLREIARGKFDLDVIGHYARPDLFQLTVDESPTATVNGAGPAIATNHRNASERPSADAAEMSIGELGRTLTPRSN
jgi:hypothetical protein